ncbi:cyclophilin-like fold protein [Methanobrevibacter sp.]|uniref:cyclophilin-like fold protein n=1 Tax=Methanobrevibacter sp. TaxID=66852 RepID=UPI0025CF0468|nr:cyclophilin-like fold protein [Methanobrevibacter sp.]MEE0024667.1 cyclophilin-like fold protein [Methanobrevibacter sp.]
MSFIKKFGLIIILGLVSCTAVSGDDSIDDSVKVKINDNVFDVKLENNSATQEFIKELKKGNVTVNASEYGGFEKVGNLGFSLPTSDKNIGTVPGDIVLYQGDKLSLFYGSHSWSYTKIGKIDNVDSNKLKEVLGSGDVTLEFSLK